jgi:hypothetical protein
MYIYIHTRIRSIHIQIWMFVSWPVSVGAVIVSTWRHVEMFFPRQILGAYTAAQWRGRLSLYTHFRADEISGQPCNREHWRDERKVGRQPRKETEIAKTKYRVPLQAQLRKLSKARKGKGQCRVFVRSGVQIWSAKYQHTASRTSF